MRNIIQSIQGVPQSVFRAGACFPETHRPLGDILHLEGIDRGVGSRVLGHPGIRLDHRDSA